MDIEDFDNEGLMKFISEFRKPRQEVELRIFG